MYCNHLLSKVLIPPLDRGQYSVHIIIKFVFKKLQYSSRVLLFCTGLRHVHADQPILCVSSLFCLCVSFPIDIFQFFLDIIPVSVACSTLGGTCYQDVWGNKSLISVLVVSQLSTQKSYYIHCQIRAILNSQSNLMYPWYWVRMCLLLLLCLASCLSKRILFIVVRGL